MEKRKRVGQRRKREDVKPNMVNEGGRWRRAGGRFAGQSKGGPMMATWSDTADTRERRMGGGLWLGGERHGERVSSV